VAGSLQPLLGAARELFGNPPWLSHHLHTLVDAQPWLLDELATIEDAAKRLVLVVGTSEAFWRMLIRSRRAVEIAIKGGSPSQQISTATPDELVELKQLELLHLAVRDLTGMDRLEDTLAGLTRLGEAVLSRSLQLAEARSCSVIAMGKLGGRELNYASDIDLLLAHRENGPPGELRDLVAIASRCYRIDLALRPEGRAGPLSRTIASYKNYWDRWAEPWEFQALLKARPIAGDEALGRAFADALHERIWSRSWGSEELSLLRSQKVRSETLIEARGINQREVKRGRGGIRDIEFAVQILQLVHGPRDQTIRSSNTLEAVDALAKAGYVAPLDAEALADDYRYLRRLEHRLQLVELQPQYALPSDPVSLERLARSMGYAASAGSSAAEAMERELRERRQRCRSVFERIYFRPLLEAFSKPLPPAAQAPEEHLSEEVVSQRLRAFGFPDISRTRLALLELTTGLGRASRLMGQLLPVILDWLAGSPNPELGLLGLRRLAERPHVRARLLEAFRESPEIARRLCLLLGASSIFTEVLLRRPEMLTEVGEDASLRIPSREEVFNQAMSAISIRPDPARARRALLGIREEAIFRIAAADLLRVVNLQEVQAGLTNVAEGLLGAAVDFLSPEPEFTVVAMGSFGAEELSYGSDLDLVIVCETDRPSSDRIQALLRFLRGSAPTEQLYSVDTQLRPEGRSGEVVRSIAAYRRYFASWAEAWERQAFLRARPVAGNQALAEEFVQAVDEFVWGTPLSEDGVRQIRRLKARVEKERIRPPDDPQFHLKLGRGSLSDVEWTVQLSQLLSRVRNRSTLSALRELESKGVFSPEEATALRESYVFCSQVRNRVYLVEGRPADSLPLAPEVLRPLALSLETTPTQLRETYRRVTRRARSVVESRFYGTA
jgi:glutamate-ammonia-ligase adenylyltransferase